MSDSSTPPTPPGRKGRPPLQGKAMTPAERKSRQRHEARVKLMGVRGGSIDLTKVSTYDLADELARCIQSGYISTAEDIMTELAARLQAARKAREEQQLQGLAAPQDSQQQAD